MTGVDPVGARARFLAGIEKASTGSDDPVALCQACVLALPVSRAGISVQVADAGLEVLCASDGAAERVEWIQITLGEGPGIDAIARGRPVVVPDLTVMNGRWPVFAPAAIESGVAGVYAMPLQIGAIRVGVLNLYRDEVARFDASGFAEATVVADLLTTMLITDAPITQVSESFGPRWEQPLRTREVHQATGMVMAQLGVTAREAYVRLQAFAYAQHRLLGDIADDVVHRRLRFDPEIDRDASTPEH